MTPTTCKLAALAGLGAALGLLGVLSVPTSTAAFSFIGGSLGTAQRDFRVFNNFSDASTNNNVTPHANFPGHTGAVMAIWKGHVEWASGPYAGNGLGDGVTSNTNLGDGGANFDNIFQGTTGSAGGSSANVHSAIPGNSGPTLAFTQSPISDGWTIKYYEGWTWHDGPGNVTSGVDLQGVACHEIGHSLGLGHSNVGGATMLPSISGTGVNQRSINSDDIAGVQAIYGVKSATKPTITGLSGSKAVGGVLVITGTQFSTTGNSVWFTKTNSDGNPATVSGLASTSGGTVINVSVPAGVVDGEVMVQKNATGHASLSNAFPIDIGSPVGDPPDVLSIDPTLGPAGGFTAVTITGAGFTGATSVKFGGIDADSFIVNSNTSITAVTPPGVFFTTVDVMVADSDGSDTLPASFFYSFDPPPDITAVTPSQGTTDGGTRVEVSGPSVVGVADVQFNGVSGTELVVTSATTLGVTTPPGVEGPVDVTAIGTGSDTLVGGFTYEDPGQFVDIGPGVGGALGAPIFTGTGSLTPGSPTGFDLHLSNTFPSTVLTMYVSVSQGALPFKGGTFYPVPVLLQFILVADSFGELNLHSTVPGSTPSGASFVLQCWMQDITAFPYNVSGSNGLKAIVP
ncbi:MAG TPA: matrixin family metalloprotease [Planctomycetota bacterium]|nr:matrixin family metalloprotease [Planctomycetota bacterium]